MKNIFTFLFSAVFILNVATAQNVGEVAPDFTLKDLSNIDYQLSANRGKVILVFLVGYNCSNCIGSAPTVKSTIIQSFESNSNYQTLIIDVWNGSAAAVQGFKSSTGLNARYLQKGSTVASDWGSTKDRLFVIDSEGKMAFKGTKVASSDAAAAKSAVQNALNNITTTSLSLFDHSEGFSLGQNYPNPAQNGTTIDFSLAKASDVVLSVFDLSGKKVLAPVNEHYPAGDFKISIQKNQLKEGIYFYRFETESFTSAKKMIIQ